MELNDRPCTRSREQVVNSGQKACSDSWSPRQEAVVRSSALNQTGDGGVAVSPGEKEPRAADSRKPH